MERIESVDGSHLSKRSQAKRAKRTKLPQVPSVFASLVQEADQEQLADFDFEDRERGRRTLEALLDEVHQSGDRLIDAQNLENIKRYRAAVQRFLDFVVRRMLAVEERTSGNGVLRRKRFTQVRVIDGKLERLLGGVLQSQGRQLDILARINEINGLLVDLIT
jgi:uncharacterized protein YaaR (DUF327 family)